MFPAPPWMMIRGVMCGSEFDLYSMMEPPDQYSTLLEKRAATSHIK
jgi:hypothetical protein